MDSSLRVTKSNAKARSRRALPPVLLQRRLRWFGHAARRPAGEIIREVINLEPPVHWRKKRGGKLKTWMTRLKEDLARLKGPAVYGLRRWNHDWMTIGIAWAQDCGAWAAGVQDTVVALMPAQPLPGECRPEYQVSRSTPSRT